MRTTPKQKEFLRYWRSGISNQTKIAELMGVSKQRVNQIKKDLVINDIKEPSKKFLMQMPISMHDYISTKENKSEYIRNQIRQDENYKSFVNETHE